MWFRKDQRPGHRFFYDLKKREMFFNKLMNAAKKKPCFISFDVMAWTRRTRQEPGHRLSEA